MDQNGTGVQYPTITLDGVTYTVKFSRALLYRMEKMGVKFAPTFPTDEHGKPAGVAMSLANLVDVLHVAIGYRGTHEELAEAVYEQRNDAVTALVVAWGKAFPPRQQPQAAAEASPASPLPQ